jgi:preprotein translocase subunit SecG
VKPVRPKEFRSFMILPFVLLQVVLAIVLGVLLHKSQPVGTLSIRGSPKLANMS